MSNGEKIMIRFLGTCFLIGLSASAAVGPIFILTFNRSATYGFLHGFVTALGSALMDGIFFILGLVGALSLITTSKTIVMIMDAIGGLILIVLGIWTIYNRKKTLTSNTMLYEKLYVSIIKSFMLTMFNPAVALFFMVVSIKFFQGVIFTASQVACGGFMVTLGSLTTLTGIALLAQYFGGAISPQRFLIVSYVSGLLFIGTGAHFIIDLIRKAFTF